MPDTVVPGGIVRDVHGPGFVVESSDTLPKLEAKDMGESVTGTNPFCLDARTGVPPLL